VFSESYRELVEYFFGNCETANDVARLERALFVQGQSIGRYRENEREYDAIRKVPVSVARDYLQDLKRYSSVEDQ